MAYIAMIEESEATGTVEEDYRFISDSYSRALLEGGRMPVPDIYRVSSIVPAYLSFIALQNRLVTEDGQHYLESDATVPRLAVGFMTARFSSCFH